MDPDDGQLQQTMVSVPCHQEETWALQDGTSHTKKEKNSTKLVFIFLAKHKGVGRFFFFIPGDKKLEFIDYLLLFLLETITLPTVKSVKVSFGYGYQ